MPRPVCYHAAKGHIVAQYEKYHAKGFEVVGVSLDEDRAALEAFVAEKKLDTPVYCILTPYPGTQSHARYRDRITVHDYDYWDLLHAVIPTRLPLREFYSEYARLWGTVPARERGILAHRDALPPEETLANVRKMRRGFRETTPERTP